jgi:hypothetical protein
MTALLIVRTRLFGELTSIEQLDILIRLVAIASGIGVAGKRPGARFTSPQGAWTGGIPSAVGEDVLDPAYPLRRW